MSEKSVLDFSSQHIKFGEAKCAIDSAVATLNLAAGEYHDIAHNQRRVPTDEERARCRGLAAYAAHTALEACKVIWSLSGASSVMSGNPLSGLYTDLLVAGQHFTNNKDANFKSYGRTLFGLELDNPTL